MLCFMDYIKISVQEMQVLQALLHSQKAQFVGYII